jgi:phage shock protein PspC (stress-responsive transcriptional regulator)
MLAGEATRIDAMNTARPFTRSRSDRMIAGVLGGIAQRFGWNSTLLRAIFVIVSIASVAFPGILVYLILWLLMPEEGA